MRLAWVDKQWNKPSRTDHYIMQNTAEIRRVLSKNPSAIKAKDFLIGFSLQKKEQITHENAPERARRSRMLWAPLISIAQKVTRGD